MKTPDTVDTLRAENLRLRAVVHSLTHPLSGRAVLVETGWMGCGTKESPATLVQFVLCAPQMDERELITSLGHELRDLFEKMGIRTDQIYETGSHIPNAKDE